MSIPALRSIDTIVADVEQIGMTAARINALHAAALESAQTALECARRCGELLLFAKEQMAHGKWLPWLKENTTVSERMAQRYMRLASRWDEICKRHDPTRVSEMSLRAAIQAVTVSVPRDAAEEMQPVEIADDAVLLETLTRTVHGIAAQCPVERLPIVVERLRIIASHLETRHENGVAA